MKIKLKNEYRSEVKKMKIYVKRSGDDWTLTDKVTGEVASIKHLIECIRIGEKPYLEKVEVSEGSFMWEEAENKYVQENKTEPIFDYTKKDNTIAGIINILGIIVILIGSLLGLLSIPHNGFLFVITYIFFSIVSGMLLIGFAQVINLLHRIEQKIK
jgi:hypothetical protein